MILAYLDRPQVSLWLFLVFGSVVAALLVGITFHEFCHCLAAYSLGDPLARNMGRLSLNPKVHLDPVGTLLLFVAGFGWGSQRPSTPTGCAPAPNPDGLAAAAGPLSNLVIAGLAGLPIDAGILPWHTPFLVPTRISFWDGADYLALLRAPRSSSIACWPSST